MTATIITTNPATGRELARYDAMPPEHIDALVDTAAAAQKSWADEDFKSRGEVLRAAATVLRTRREELAVLVTREMGKPLVESRGEVDKCAIGLEFYADHAHQFLADEQYATDADRSWVSYEPVGIVLAIMPWNFPLWQVFRFAAPALMAGTPPCSSIRRTPPAAPWPASRCCARRVCPPGCSPPCSSPNPMSRPPPRS